MFTIYANIFFPKHTSSCYKTMKVFTLFIILTEMIHTLKFYSAVTWSWKRSIGGKSIQSTSDRCQATKFEPAPMPSLLGAL